MRTGVIVCLLIVSLAPRPASARETGRDIYMNRCFWCHGERGDGDGPSAAGMFPRPRDFVRAEYKIRSTPYGQLPTDEDLFRVISRGLAGTPMGGWEKILTQEERWQLASYVKSLSPRFASEKGTPLSVPSGGGSVERGEKVFRAARCWTCHGDTGRANGGITTALNFEWGLPYSARDFTQGWTFKGGREPRDLYLRITGGLNGTPMGPYQDLLSEQERWDLAHYVASLDQEPSETSNDFVVVGAQVEGEIEDAPEAPSWGAARPITVALAGQVVLDPPVRWWTPTATSATVRALTNGRGIGFLVEWNDPTGPESAFRDSALLQFAARDESKPYFLFGNSEDPVKVWQWQTDNRAEEWIAVGRGKIHSMVPSFQVSSLWKEGRWRVIFRAPLGSGPNFAPGKFVPFVVSVRDGANGEFDEPRAISTWLYATLGRPPSPRPWLSALAYLLAAVIVELWVLARLKR